VVGVPTLSGESVGGGFDASVIDLLALFHKSKKVTGKRDIEDAIVAEAIREPTAAFRATYDAIEQADWYVLSARKADRLLKDMLFDRVFALRVRGFARVFRGAELDMHFSLSRDLTPLPDFLKILREEGLTKVATLMERGEV
jgi:hypothetical protein